MQWSPPDITPACVESYSHITACTNTGYMFLALIAQLFGKPSPGFSVPRHLYRDRSLEPLGPEFGYKSVYEGPRLGPVFPEPGYSGQKIETVAYGPGSHSVATSSYYENPFSVQRELPRNPFIKDLDFEFSNRYIDAEVADTKKVDVKKEEVDAKEHYSHRRDSEKGDRKKNKRERKKRHVGEEFDFIIVGAGSAGCVLANRLSEVKKWRVLLIEAGPEEPDVTSVPAFAPALSGSSIDWGYRTQPEEKSCLAQRGGTCPSFRGKVMGGCSATNYLVYIRGNKKDYDDWAALGNPGWSYAEVLPYFKKSENNNDIEGIDHKYHGVKGPLNVERFHYPEKNVMMLVEALKETGLPLTDFNGEQQIGTMVTQTTSIEGKRVSTNEAFIKPIRHERKNLKVITEAEVTKILIDAKENAAYGVKYIKHGKWYEAYASKEIVVSAGSYNSAKLLMLSGIGPKKQLEQLKISVIKDLKVGYSMQDHVTTEAMVMALSNKTSTLISPGEINYAVKEFNKDRSKNSPLAATGPLHMTAFIRTELADKDVTVPDVQLHFDGRNLKDFYLDTTTYLATNMFPFAYYDGINARPVLLLPKSRGYMKLNRTHPVFGPPLIYQRFFTDENDLNTLIAALEFVASLENTKVFKDYGVHFVKRPVQACSKFKWGTRDYFSCILTRYTGTIFHPTGTCRMGPKSDKFAVVDPRLRVYSVKNLRVADASIMPNIVRGNTNAPVIMIGEKASDMIKEEWSQYD